MLLYALPVQPFLFRCDLQSWIRRKKEKAVPQEQQKGKQHILV